MQAPQPPSKKPPAKASEGEASDPLAMLTTLGFGPETVLMNDPKLFVDGRFLASLLVELDDELGPRDAGLALFQIGLLHGLRDAARVCRENERDDASGPRPSADSPSLVMQVPRGVGVDPTGALALEGRWPERHEATARLARLGASGEARCWLSAGYTTGWLSSVLDRAVIAHEVECAARGDASCRFELRESSAWQECGDPVVDWLLAEVPFEAFRKLALAPAVDRRDAPPHAHDLPDEGRFDRSQPVVHIWGPVMVLPFTTLDEALGTIDMLGRDPGIAEIRSVVVDLREQPLDEGFGAAALEQILETIESWNAQSLVTGVSPAAEAAMSSLESSHLVLRKDLPEAIATAFQIADAQKFRL